MQRSKTISETHLTDPWLTIARAGWIIIAILTIGLDIAAIPFAYAYFLHICTAGAACSSSDLLTPGQVQALHGLGLSLNFYAIYYIMVESITTLVYAAVAFILFWRRSDDRMALFGSLMLITFGGAAFTGTMQQLPHAYPIWHLPVAILDYSGQICFFVFFYLFPGGHFIPRWTWILAVIWAGLEALVIFFPQSSFNFDSPLGGLVFIIFVGSVVVAQIYRYRRVSSPNQRQQTKWVVFSFAIATTGFLTFVLLDYLLPQSVKQRFILGDLISFTAAYVFVLIIPLSIGIAILRSRLWDIDILINRTLVYGILTGLLAFSYFGIVFLLQFLLRGIISQTNGVAIVVSTLAIASLFQPLRHRIQSIIDRRFYRHKYDAAQTIAAFSATLRNEVDLDQLCEQLTAVVQETMQPSHISLWLRGRDHKQTQTASKE